MSELSTRQYSTRSSRGARTSSHHTAEKGSGFRDTSTLHRSDPEAVKKEVEAAGFKFVGQSEVLRNADDQHTAKVFDAAVQGKTDQYILKFRKPK